MPAKNVFMGLPCQERILQKPETDTIILWDAAVLKERFMQYPGQRFPVWEDVPDVQTRNDHTYFGGKRMVMV